MTSLATLAQDLLKIGVDGKTLKKLVKVSRNNNDVGEVIYPGTEISPIIIDAYRDRPMIKLIKSLSIYNFYLRIYDDQIWYFTFLHRNGTKINNKVGKHEFERPIVYEEAFGIALLMFNNAWREQEAAAETLRATRENDIEPIMEYI